MLDRTENGNDSSDEPEPVSPDPRPFLVRLWGSGIPLWQKLLVWAGAAGVGWVIFQAFDWAWDTRSGFIPGESVPPPSDWLVYRWVVFSLAFSVGLWIWPLTRGRWRIVALVLAVPATLKIMIVSPQVAILLLFSFTFFSLDLQGVLAFLLFGIIPLLPYPALVVVWVRAIQDFRTSRRI